MVPRHKILESMKRKIYEALLQWKKEEITLSLYKT